MFSARLVAARNSDKVSEWHGVRFGNLAEAGGEGGEYSYYTELSTSKASRGMMMIMMMMMMCLTPLLLPAAVYRNTEPHSFL
jgi:hypothetical protein